MSSLFDAFDTNKDYERDGIEVVYDDAVRVIIARAGGSNSKYRKALQALSAPLRRKIENEQISDEESTALLARAYSQAVILRMDITDGKGGWKEGKLTKRDGKVVDSTPENVFDLLIDLPEFFADIQSIATRAATFREEELEADEGNSKQS